jgi:hypothetical protein
MIRGTASKIVRRGKRAGFTKLRKELRIVEGPAFSSFWKLDDSRLEP